MRKYLYLAVGAGLSGVAAGAFGAHALKTVLQANGMLSVWNTAVLYHLIHALALLATGFQLVNTPSESLWLRRACVAWTVGIGLFSGSLYWLALGGPRWLGPCTPLGGVFLMLGWALSGGFALKIGQNSSKEP